MNRVLPCFGNVTRNCVKEGKLDESLISSEWLLYCNLVPRVSHLSALLEQEGRVSRSGRVGRRETLGMRLALLLGHRIISCYHQFLLYHGMQKATHPIFTHSLGRFLKISATFLMHATSFQEVIELYELPCINKTYILLVTVPTWIWHKNVVGCSRNKQ